MTESTGSEVVSEAQRKAFYRAYLEAMRNMATIAAYVFAIAYLGHRHVTTTWDKSVMFVAIMALTMVAYFGAQFASDILWEAVHLRFPRVRNSRVVRVLGAIVMAAIASAPMYLTYFRGE